MWEINLIFPPHAAQTITSIAKERLRSSDQLRFLGRSSAGFSLVVAAGVSVSGTIFFRSLALGAKTPW
jgi:hypothetical protein